VEYSPYNSKVALTAFDQHHLKIKHSEWVDTALAMEIVDLAQFGLLMDVMKEHPMASYVMKDTNDPLPCLVAAFHQVLGRREKRAEQEKKPMSHTYNAETFLEFHILLITVLHGYKNALIALFKETKNRNKGIPGGGA
jgi:hypothetical protein